MCKLRLDDQPFEAGASVAPGPISLASSIPPGEGEDPTARLSSRQRMVAKLAVQGMTNREIGEKLFISEETVKRHLYNIYTLLGVKNRVQLLGKLSGFRR